MRALQCGRIQKGVAPMCALFVACAAGIVGLNRCRPAPTPGQTASDASSSSPAHAGEPSGKSGVNALDQVFGEKLPPTTVHFTLPELPFVEHSEGLPKSGTWRGYPLLADFDGDGLADLVVSNREEDGFNVWQASKSGAWKLCNDGLDRTMAYGPARAADVNSDGIPDLVLAAHTDSLRVYLNDGHMKWTLAARLLHDDNPELLLDIAFGNLNGDAVKDMVGMCSFKGGLSVLLGDGHASTEAGHTGFKRLAESRTILGSKVMGRTVELSDLDGDGTDDIVAATNVGARAFLTHPGKTFEWEDVSAGLPNPKIGNSIYAARVGRFVAGGWPQIAIGALRDPTDKSPDDLGVYAFDPRSRAWDHIDKGLPRASACRDLAVADFDKDGNLDLFVMSLQDGGAIFRGDGKGGFEPFGRLAGVNGGGYVAVGDIDGDGWTDIVVVQPAEKEHPEEGSIRALLNRPEIWSKQK